MRIINNELIEKRRKEKELVKVIATFFAQRNYIVFRNVQFLDIEIDIVAIKELRDGKYLVAIVEVKSLPKQKLIKQILARKCIANKVYAGLPAQYYEWAVKKLPNWCGIITVNEDNNVEIKRRATYFDNINALHFAKILLTCGKLMSAKIYPPQTDGLKILRKISSFLSSFSSDSSSCSSSLNSLKSLEIPIMVYSFIFTTNYN